MVKVEVINGDKTIRQLENIVRLYYESCYNAAEKTVRMDYTKNIQPYYNKYTPKKTGKLRKNKQPYFNTKTEGDTISVGIETVYRQPYARYQYFHHFSHYTTPNTDGEWDKKAAPEILQKLSSQYKKNLKYFLTHTDIR